MNLRTTYMGLHLRSPIVASASPLSREVDNINRRNIYDPTAFERANYIRILEKYK